jgi:hypothetical protein
MISVYSENHIKHINTPCGQNADLLNVVAGGITSNRSALNDSVYTIW